MLNPKNELEVLYWFSRLHEKLGFEEILRIRFGKFPDVIAKRDGKVVKVELEYKLSRFKDHYYAYRPSNYGRALFWSGVLKWVWKDGVWLMYHRDYGILRNGPRFEDPDKSRYYLDGPFLKYRSLRDLVDVVVCWIVDCELPEPIEVICLRDYAAEMRRDPLSAHRPRLGVEP